MKRWAAAALLLAGAAVAQPLISTTPVASYWMRVYPLPAYGEIWRLSIHVRDLKKSLPKALSILEKEGGKPVIPIANMASSTKQPFQQLSFQLSARAAASATARLQRLGEVESLAKNAGMAPGMADEVGRKLEALKAERAANASALAKMPSIQAAVEEIERHLEQVSNAERSAASQVLLNLELRQAPAR